MGLFSDAVLCGLCASVVNFSFQEHAIPPVYPMRHTADRDGV